jgi:hypothetical protein
MFVTAASLAGRGVQSTAGLLCDSSMSSFAKACGSALGAASPAAPGTPCGSLASSPPRSSSLEQQFGVRPVRDAATGSSGRLEVVAGPSTPTRTRATHRSGTAVGRHALAASRAKARKGRRGGSGGGWDDDDGSSFWLSSDGRDGWEGGSFGGAGGGGGSGWNQGPSSGDEFYYRAQVHGMWLWQLLCVGCLAQTFHFLMFPKRVHASEGSRA